MTFSQSALSGPEAQSCISRRAILKGSAVMAMGTALPSACNAAVEQAALGISSDLPRKGRVIDCHAPSGTTISSLIRVAGTS